jgi:antitoxin component of MazEF toxin-antitoxin module
MPRKIVQAGASLAVTLPKDIVEQPGLKKGDEVEVSAHPLNGTIIVRTAVRAFDDGKVTRRFRRLTADLLRRREALSRAREVIIYLSATFPTRRWHAQ